MRPNVDVDGNEHGIVEPSRQDRQIVHNHVLWGIEAGTCWP